MFRIKKIDSYIFKRFVTLFLMTFFICILILLMQFLWKHVDELIGKGIGLSVLGEFFIYAIFSMVPMALPLAILLASIMTFGNLGENFELTAMKAAGISLFRIMRLLIIFISIVCIGAFYFSNYVMPIAQTKLWTLIFSLRQKSPEFDIPVGQFYSGMRANVNIYVRKKSNGLLKDLMIYDFSTGFESSTVMVSDSGRIQFTSDNKYLLLTLYDGESFANMQKGINSSTSNIPYRRETFKTKVMLFDFDNAFTRYDESVLKDQHVSKNVIQLTHSIDSVSKISLIRSTEQAKEMISKHYLGREDAMTRITTGKKLTRKELAKINADSLFMSLNQDEMVRANSGAIERARTIKDQIQFNKMMLEEPIRYIRRHQIEWHRKFTLSFACLIFFFIGAPLGAIIRKGGLGAPVVISVIMFIFYYIIDNSGYKMAREGLWSAFQGMWLSSAVLLPIGIFLTYKAVVDATLFNRDQYTKFIRHIKSKINRIINRAAN